MVPTTFDACCRYRIDGSRSTDHDEARGVQHGNLAGVLIQDASGARHLVGLPHIVLIAERDVVDRGRREAQQTEKALRKTHVLAAHDLEIAPCLVLPKEGHRAVRGPVVTHENLHGRVILGEKALHLRLEVVHAVVRGEEDLHGR